MMGPTSLSEIKKQLEEALAKDPGVLDRIETEQPIRPHPVVDALRELLDPKPPKRKSKKAGSTKTGRGAGATKK